MSLSHETIKDDNLTQLHFSRVEASNDLLLPHWHNHLEIIYLVKGQMTAYINETSYELLPGDILLVNPRAIHYTHVHGDSGYCLLQIPSAHLERMDSDWKMLHFSEYIPCSRAEDSVSRSLSSIFEEFIRLDTGRQKGTPLLFLSQLYQLLYLLYTRNTTHMSVQSQNRTERDFLRIEQSMQYVKKNYRHPISLSEAAAQLCVTPEYFCRFFKKCTGQTFFSYVAQIRLLHFYQELLQTDESITFLLEHNGITNYKQFMRTFKEAYGTTPHRLRMQKQPKTP